VAQGPQAGPPPAGPTWFDINQQRLNVDAELHLETGNDLIFQYPPLDTTGIASIEKARGLEFVQTRLRREIKKVQRTGTGTQADRNRLDDLRLELQATQDQTNRRRAELIPTPVIPFNAVFESRAHDALIQLGRNQKKDAQIAMSQEPSRDNWIKLRAARDDIQQQESWLAANRFDILGAGNDLGKIAPFKRLEASEIALETARRAWRQARANYDADPSEDNWWEVRLNNVKLDALEADIRANKGEASFKAFTTPTIGNFVLGQLLMNVAFDEEEDHWLKYNRLSLKNLRRKHAQAGRPTPPSGSVQSRMLALADYGPQALY
jgi:hypothetical protein